MSFKSRSTSHLRSFDTETQFAAFQVIFEYYAGDDPTLTDICTICWSWTNSDDSTKFMQSEEEEIDEENMVPLKLMPITC